MKEPRILLKISLIDLSLLILTLIQRWNSSGLMTCTAEILISPFARCMANFALKRVTLGIPVPFTRYRRLWAFLLKLHQSRRNVNLRNITPLSL